MLPYKSLIQIDKSLPQPVFIQIANGFIHLIHSGRLQSGTLLPGTRSLSKLLGVNRKTAINAYEELIAQGWFVSHSSSGTFVSSKLPEIRYKPIKAGTSRTHLNNFESCGFDLETSGSSIEFTYNQQKWLEVDDGSPDERLMETKAFFGRISSIASSPLGRNLLCYHDVQGEPYFRKVLSDYLSATRGLQCKEQHIFITRGSQMAIYLIFKILLKPNDIVVVGESFYPTAGHVIEEFGGKIMKVPVDKDGLDIDALEILCKNHKVRAIYITPHHHFPTTVTLSATRRLALLHLSVKYRLAILEDDYDYDFHFSSNPILPLASLDNENQVIYVGGFSKLLAPAIRIGYIVAPDDLIHELSQRRKTIDRQGDPLMERVLGEMISEGELQRHLKKSINIYRSRRDHFCHLLKTHLKDYVRFEIPEGGMVVWTVFRKDIDLILLSKELARKKILLNPQPEYVTKYNAVRFGFASLTFEEMDETFEALNEILPQLVRSENGQIDI